jgi:glycerophosphoryl diester phosphodiesterase
MSDRPGGIVRFVVTRIAGASRSLVPFALAFQLLSVALLTPLAAGALRYFLGRWGRASVGNFEIAAFLLTGPGLAAMVAVGVLSLVTLYFEIAGIMRLLAEPRLAWWQGLLTSTGKLHRMALLGLRQLLTFFGLAVPFLAAIGIVYATLWAGRDIYPLVVLKPPAFWAGAGLAGLIAAVYLAIAGRLFLRWLLALPTLLFEPGVGVSGALASSWERTRGRWPRMLAVLLGLGLVELAVSAAALGGLKWASDAILERLGTSLAVALPATALLLAVHGLLVSALSIAGVIALAAVVLALYREAVGPEVPLAVVDEDGPPAPRFWLSFRRAVFAGLLALVGVVAYGSYAALHSLRLGDALEITAHRAGAAHAPENTIVALRRAAADGADWAEIDVVRTADDRLVVMHDTDLVRVANSRKRVSQATLAEIEAIDVGAQFSPEFAGERIPTFEAFLDAAKALPIRLNVELKPEVSADAEPLARKTVAAIQAAGMAERCRVCSQSDPAIRLARRLEPKLQIGFIVARALGDPATLDVDFLMVETDLATRSLVRRARLRGMEVHAWSVKDPGLVARLLDHGVANIITDDPAMIRARFDEIRDLSAVDRLLLRARTALTE